MRIKLKNTPEQVELVKALGSNNKLTSLEAQEALAAFIAPVAREVIEKAKTLTTSCSSYCRNGSS